MKGTKGVKNIFKPSAKKIRNEKFAICQLIQVFIVIPVQMNWKLLSYQIHLLIVFFDSGLIHFSTW